MSDIDKQIQREELELQLQNQLASKKRCEVSILKGRKEITRLEETIVSLDGEIIKTKKLLGNEK